MVRQPVPPHANHALPNRHAGEDKVAVRDRLDDMCVGAELGEEFGRVESDGLGRVLVVGHEPFVAESSLSSSPWFAHVRSEAAVHGH